MLIIFNAIFLKLYYKYSKFTINHLFLITQIHCLELKNIKITILNFLKHTLIKIKLMLMNAFFLYKLKLYFLFLVLKFFKEDINVKKILSLISHEIHLRIIYFNVFLFITSK